jgi:hypothetical protein
MTTSYAECGPWRRIPRLIRNRLLAAYLSHRESHCNEKNNTRFFRVTVGGELLAELHALSYGQRVTITVNEVGEVVNVSLA